MTTYKESGVDIKVGDDFSKFVYKQIKSTWETSGWNKIVTPFDNFSGVRGIDISGLEDVILGMNFDGIGTKVEIAEKLNRYYTLGYDLMAMVCDDAVIRGAEPILVGSILDFNHIPLTHSAQLKELIEGYVNAAKEAGVQIINGEIAELGGRVQGYGPMNLNWGAGLIWLAKKDRLISGKDIAVGDKVIMFREDGFRSNGLSLVRKILEGLDAELSNNKRDFLLGSILKPSKIYSKFITKLTGGVQGEKLVNISGMAHITGGGIPGKIGRMLRPCKFGANLQGIFEPPQIMKYFQQEGKVLNAEAYKTWNMGNGFALVTKDYMKVLTLAKENNIYAKVAGEIIEEPVIKIADYGVYSGDTLTFNLLGEVI